MPAAGQEATPASLVCARARWRPRAMHENGCVTRLKFWGAKMRKPLRACALLFETARGGDFCTGGGRPERALQPALLQQWPGPADGPPLQRTPACPYGAYSCIQTHISIDCQPGRANRHMETKRSENGWGSKNPHGTQLARPQPFFSMPAHWHPGTRTGCHFLPIFTHAFNDACSAHP